MVREGGPETSEQQESANQSRPSSSSPHSLKRDATEAEMDKLDDEMEITLVEKLIQEDMKWNKSVGSDMWTEHPDTGMMDVNMNDFDEKQLGTFARKVGCRSGKGGHVEVEKRCR